MSSFAVLGLATDELQSFIKGTHSDPFRILGPHRVGDDLVSSRVSSGCARDRDRASIRKGNSSPRNCTTMDFTRRPSRRETRIAIITCARCAGMVPNGRCTIRIVTARSWARWISTFLPKDSIGSCTRNSARILRTIGDEAGVYFPVWAPNAQRVSVVGDFNGWDGRVNPMRKLVGSGVWELFLPGVDEGAHYKFEIRDAARRAAS